MRTGEIHNDGITISFSELGSGPLLIFLHGFPDSSVTWEGIASHFSRSYRVVVPDLRGYGKSSRPKRISEYKMIKLVGDIVNLIKSFKDQNVFLVGHDWGGAIAMQVAAYHPELVKQLIVLNAPPPARFRMEFGKEEQRKKSRHLFSSRKNSGPNY